MARIAGQFVRIADRDRTARASRFDACALAIRGRKIVGDNGLHNGLMDDGLMVKSKFQKEGQF